MEDVTDASFRAIIAKYSKNQGGKSPTWTSEVQVKEYVTFTEFTSADGLVFADEKGQEKLRAKFRFGESERPIVAQIFGAIPKHMETATNIARELGFDGIDINMGCPDKSVEKQGAGAALIQNPELAQEIIYATKEGAKDLPVSVKTRIGYDTNELDTWLPKLLETKPSAITLHARTRKEMSKVPAQWDTLKQAVAIRNSFCNSAELQNESDKTLIIGNGDVRDVAHARSRAEESGVDGVMIGRGMFGNPWVMSGYTPTLEEKLKVLIEHAELFETEFAGIKSFATMRKHFSSYVEGFAGAKELRIKLMNCVNAKQVKETIEEHLL